MGKDILEGENIESEFQINKDFADRYERRKRTEEIQRLEEKYTKELIEKKDRKEEEEEESMSTSDEVGELATADIDLQILKTIASIKGKEEKIYDPKVEFFNSKELKDAQELLTQRKEKAEKKEVIGYKAYLAKSLLENEKSVTDGTYFDEEEEKVEAVGAKEKSKNIKEEFQRQVEIELVKEEAKEEEILTVKDRSKEDVEKEDSEYRDFLLNNLNDLEGSREKMTDWLEFREGKKNVSTNEDFLIKYIIGRGWVGKEAKKIIPDFDKIREIEDMEEEEKAEVIETAYNFRHEQTGGGEMESYSRQIEGVVRAKDLEKKEKRRKAREEKGRKELEKEEDIKRYKSMKKKEIRSKQKFLAKVGGEEIAKKFKYMDIESEFDPEVFDKRMEEIFDDEYYENKKDSKEFLELSMNLEKEVSKPNGKVTEVARKVVQELIDLTKEYSEIGKEGKAKVKFTYKKVVPSSFGLRTKDILYTPDSILNQYVPIKKVTTHKSEEEQLRDTKKYGNKKRVAKFRSMKYSLQKEGEGESPAVYDEFKNG